MPQITYHKMLIPKKWRNIPLLSILDVFYIHSWFIDKTVDLFIFKQPLFPLSHPLTSVFFCSCSYLKRHKMIIAAVRAMSDKVCPMV